VSYEVHWGRKYIESTEPSRVECADFKRFKLMPSKAYIACMGLLVGLSLATTPALDAPAFGDPGQPYRGPALMLPTGHEVKLAEPNPTLPAKPGETWECVSSWYGDDFDGQPTASGEIYDMYANTAAHRTLPLGSLVRVVNLKTHRSAVVRINDRGPYVDGRQLDVSYGVAQQLGFDEEGLAQVRLEILEVPQRSESPNHLNE
jgi:rare lipoprotein A (peptidoglycan hydrolase)